MNVWSLVTEFHVLNIQDFLDATDQNCRCTGKHSNGLSSNLRATTLNALSLHNLLLFSFSCTVYCINVLERHDADLGSTPVVSGNERHLKNRIIMLELCQGGGTSEPG
jgi:hypothetical protein